MSELMISTSTRLLLKDILQRIATGKEVTLQERIYLGKFADRNQTVANSLRRANRLQQKQELTNPIVNKDFKRFLFEKLFFGKGIFNKCDVNLLCKSRFILSDHCLY